MLEKTVLASPVTQSREAVQSLIAYHNHGVEPQEMPTFYRLTGEMVLVLNNKKDAYYVTTPKTCSCPAVTYHPGQPCKHARKYFPGPQKSRVELEAEGEEILAAHNAGGKKLARPVDSIKPAAKWPGGHNGPVDEVMGVA